ncbi:hypothetical protein GQ53DRAFT_128337 [Thozetella sp. PMI_491]|nr:hypothetical protein GQ53DRAFT_128337 [Thozetella sp. PMI_491]
MMRTMGGALTQGHLCCCGFIMVCARSPRFHRNQDSGSPPCTSVKPQTCDPGAKAVVLDPGGVIDRDVSREPCRLGHGTERIRIAGYICRAASAQRSVQKEIASGQSVTDAGCYKSALPIHDHQCGRQIPPNGDPE